MQKINYGCEDLVVVISGGTSGIGLATATALLNDGAKVYILGSNEIRGQKAVAKLKEQNFTKVTYLKCDVTNVSECKLTMKKIGTEHKKIDTLINSAGIYQEQRLENMQEEDYTKLMDVNVKGTMFLIQSALPYMYGGGNIVNIASDAAVNGNYGCPLYCASKGAVTSLTRALALDLAPSIRVNCVCPADVATPLLEKQLQDANSGYNLTEMAAAYPLGRIGKAEEIAHVICGMVSPSNSFMTGSIVCVDGGITAG